MVIKRLLLVGAVVASLFATTAAHAEESKNKGLLVSPVREYVTAAPGASQQKTIALANNTEVPITVTLSVGQFTVANYNYDVTFQDLKEDWVKLSKDRVELEPGKSVSINYVVAPPQDATPGGHYFTIFASATVQTGRVASKVRAAATVYVAVQGDLMLSSTVQKIELPWVVFGGDIGFSMDVKDTGNTHFFVYVAGSLQGPEANGKGPEATHLLMPGKVRTVGSTIPAPPVPGMYTAHVGYTTDGGETVERSQKILYIPPWSLFLLGGIVWIAIAGAQRHKRRLRCLRIPRDDRVGHS